MDVAKAGLAILIESRAIDQNARLETAIFTHVEALAEDNVTIARIDHVSLSKASLTPSACYLCG